MPAPMPSATRPPGPVLDLSKPADRSVAMLAKSLLQAEAFDPLGAIIRTSTRSYKLNEDFRRQNRVGEALTALSDLSQTRNSPLTPADLEQLQARLLLSTKLFGGWVDDRGLPIVYSADITKIEGMRGHNWDLLRQAAESNGLLFEPLRLAGGPPSHAILWVAKSDLKSNSSSKHFNGRFLNIKTPWGDPQLLDWKGYTAERLWRGQQTQMIPLAVYSLDHPKVFQLVADMRDGFAPSRREMFRRAVTDSTVGVLGLSATANIGVFAAVYSWQFVTSRWGAPNDRSWRVRAYAELRYRLAIDTTLDTDLRKELSKRADWLALNPFEESLASEVRASRIQQAALVRWAESPKARVKLNKDRREELALLRRSEDQRFWANATRIATLGLYRKRARDTAASYNELAIRRKVAAHEEFLAQILRGGNPHPEVSWNQGAVRNAIFELGRLKPDDPEIAKLVNQVLDKMEDTQTKAALVDAWYNTEPGSQP
jgi:hypothetical protein